MNYDIRTKLWDQLDAEILLQRHKTVIKVMRQQKNHDAPPDDIAGRVRSVHLHRDPSKGLGISITVSHVVQKEDLLPHENQRFMINSYKAEYNMILY